MSIERKKSVEFFVGLFLLIGFSVIATMIVTFGRAGRGMEERYNLRIRFPNASGLVKGSSVLLSGANIGDVSQAPTLTGENYEVEVGLSIRKAVKVPRTAIFQIRSAGMLGDAYVDVVPPGEFTPADFAEPNELITGKRTGGFDDLTSKGSQVMDTLNRDVLKKVSATLDEIKATTVNLNEKLLSEKNLTNVEGTFQNLKTTTDDLTKTIKDLDGMIGRAHEVVDSAKGTMKTIDGAAGDLRLTLGDFRKTSESARTLVTKATGGEGALGTLISDKQTAEDLKALISNMRRSGVLWYKNKPTTGPEATPTPPAPAATPKKR
jgi:phospholipid/cholesterol/gamma-HCH transport system substrate-binding protein